MKPREAPPNGKNRGYKDERVTRDMQTQLKQLGDKGGAWTAEDLDGLGETKMAFHGRRRHLPGTSSRCGKVRWSKVM